MAVPMQGLWRRVRALLSGTAIVRVVSGGRRTLGQSSGWGLGLHCEQKNLLACSVAERLVVKGSSDSVAERLVVRESFDSAAERFVVRESFDSVGVRIVVKECFDSVDASVVASECFDSVAAEIWEIVAGVD